MATGREQASSAASAKPVGDILPKRHVSDVCGCLTQALCSSQRSREFRFGNELGSLYLCCADLSLVALRDSGCASSGLWEVEKELQCGHPTPTLSCVALPAVITAI
ncbi:hypothetical protein TNCV_332471 [Trichonephila clavipes]|nr:hypothetical protein TNCV_332471 [Trichonephila clavipes]